MCLRSVFFLSNSIRSLQVLVDVKNVRRKRRRRGVTVVITHKTDAHLQKQTTIVHMQLLCSFSETQPVYLRNCCLVLID